MALTLLSSQTPVLMGPTDFSSLAAAMVAVSPTLLTASRIETGDIVISTPFNSNAKRLDLIARYGGGCYGVVYGLTLTAGAAGNVNVAAGQAICDGIAELAAATDFPVTLSVRNHVWILRNSSIDVRADLTQPAMNGVYLGSVLADGTGVVSIETGGRILNISGIGYREFADRGMPVDSPPANVAIVSKTSAGIYLWNGASHQPNGPTVNIETLTANKVLTVYDADTQVLTPSGATRSVEMPTGLSMGRRFVIHNGAAATYNLNIKTPGGGAILATATPGQYAEMVPRAGGSYTVGTSYESVATAIASGSVA